MLSTSPCAWMHRVAVSLGSGLLVAVIAARTVLPAGSEGAWQSMQHQSCTS